MSQINKHLTKQKNIPLCFSRIILSVVLFVFAIGGISAPVSYAEPASTGTLDVLSAYCADKLSTKLEKVCDDKIIESALNVATYHCTDKSTQDNEMYNCIVKTGKSYIKEAADKYSGASSVSEFTDKFERLLKTKGGSLNTPASGSSQSINPQSTTLQDSPDPAIKGCKSNNCDFVDKYVNPAITLLTFSFGLIAVISLIIGGVQYSASGGDPQNVAKAKKRITDTLIAVVAYFFLFTFLQFLIPGGLFNR